MYAGAQNFCAQVPNDIDMPQLWLSQDTQGCSVQFQKKHEPTAPLIQAH